MKGLLFYLFIYFFLLGGEGGQFDLNRTSPSVIYLRPIYMVSGNRDNPPHELPWASYLFLVSL